VAIGTPVVRYGARKNVASGAATVSPTSTIAAGTRAVLFGGCPSAHNLSSVVDSVGNTWTIHASVTDGTSARRNFIASAQIATQITTGDTVTLHRTDETGSVNFDFWIVEISGLATSSAFDVTGNQAGSGTSYTSGSTGTLSQANEIAIAVWTQGATATPTHTPGGGWTEFSTSFVSTATAVYQIVAATTALNASETSTNTNWLGLIGTFKAASTAPANTVAPAVTGTATVGSVLTTSNGTWTDDGSPTFTYQWQRDNAGGGSYSNISSAKSSTYTLVDADDACQVRCVVTDTDSNGATSANSNVKAILEPVPTNSVAPVASGTAQVGQTVSATTGTWTHQGGTVATYAYQWQDSADGSSGWANIASATSSTYSIAVGELTKFLRCNVTATNSGGAGSAASSNVLGAVVAASSGSNPALTNSGSTAFLRLKGLL
jgi:hypothetical protein